MIFNHIQNPTTEALTYCTVNNKNPDRLMNTSEYGVIQCLTTSASCTLRLPFVHVKFVNKPATWSWVFKSPAINCPNPRGKDTDATSSETMPG